MSISEPPPFERESLDPLRPRGPWSFLRSALPGGGRRWGLHLLLSWLAFYLLTNVLWAVHLTRLAGWSSLPSYWGELLTVRDLWELLENGGLKHHWSGPFTPIAAGLAMVWFLWAGWRVQTRAADLEPAFGPWAWGFLDAVLIGALPLGLVGGLMLWFLGKLGGTGIQGLAWLDVVAGLLVRLSCLSVFFLQWWLCRLSRAMGARGWLLGGWPALGRHLADTFLQLWLYPMQWGAVVLGGVVVRTGLPFLVLLLAWRWGGGTPVRVWSFLLLQVAAVLVDAWLLGWYLRLTAQFGRHDAAVRHEIRQLQAAAGGGGQRSWQ